MTEQQVTSKHTPGPYVEYQCRCGERHAMGACAWIEHRFEHLRRGLTYWGDRKAGATS